MVNDTDAQETDNADAPAQMKKPDLMDRTVARSGLKKRDVKPAVEAALAEIADALLNGEDLILPPLGRVRIIKSKELDGGSSMLTLRLRTPKTAVVADAAAPSDDEDDE